MKKEFGAKNRKFYKISQLKITANFFAMNIRKIRGF